MSSRLPGLAAALVLLAGSAAAAPLQVHSNPRWLAWGDGSPLFLCGPSDPEDFFYRGSQNPDGTRSGDQQLIIDKMIGTGANCLYVMAVRSHGGDGTSTHNPFIGHDPAAGFNAAVLDQWDGWLTQLDAAGIISFFVIYDDGTRIWNTGSVVGAEEEAFFTDLVNRFEHLDNLIWCLGEEYEEAYLPVRVEAFASIVATADDFGHPISVSQLNGDSFHFPGHPDLHSFAMQINNTLDYGTIHGRVVNAFGIAAGQYNVNLMEVRYHYSGREETRKRCWAAAMGGGYVMVHQMFVANTPVEAIEDCGRLATFFQSTPFPSMSPQDSRARGATDYVFGEESAGWILYAEDAGGALGISLPTGSAGPYDLRWLNCESGAEMQESGVSLTDGDNLLPIPSGLGTEVVVYAGPASATSASSGVETSTWARTKAAYRRR